MYVNYADRQYKPLHANIALRYFRKTPAQKRNVQVHLPHYFNFSVFQSHSAYSQWNKKKGSEIFTRKNTESHKEKDPNSLDQRWLYRMRLHLPWPILWNLNTGVTCFGIPNHHNSINTTRCSCHPCWKCIISTAEPFLGKDEHNSVLRANVQSQVWALLQAATYNTVSVCSDENKTFPPQETITFHTLLHIIYWHLLEKYLFYGHFSANVRRSNLSEHHNTEPIQRAESSAYLWCNHYPGVAWPHLVFIISHA